MDENDLDPGFFTPPPFRPDEALQRLRRELRDLGLTERAGVFEQRGSAVLRAAVSADGSTLEAALVRRLARQPEWQARTVRQGGQLRDLLADVRRRLADGRDDD